MSVYSIEGKGWRYDFTLRGTRYTKAWFKTKKAARKAEGRRREVINTQESDEKTLTDMDFGAGQPKIGSR